VTVAYVGPIPPAPIAFQSDPAWYQQWQVYQTYQTLVQNIAYTNEREARAVVTDRQHTEKMAHEDACAASNTALAAAQQAQADAIRYMVDNPESKKAPWTDEDLVRQLLFSLAEAGVTELTALEHARSTAQLLRLLFPMKPSAQPTTNLESQP